MNTNKIRFFFLALLATLSLTANAQSADKLYQEGKTFYDAKNYVQAFPKLKAAADKGNKKAQYRLARCYDKGKGTAENNDLAFQWYIKSANQGYAKAQHQLAKCYFKGKGVAVDKVQAKKWLTKAVRNEKGGKEILDELKKEKAEGDEDAKNLLGLIGK